MNIFSNIYKYFIYTSLLILVYLSYLLVSNTSSGFDITDESYYILSALYYDEIFSTVTHDMYYTGLLFWLSGYDLGYFRLFGVSILLSVSIWFSKELYKYISDKLDVTYDRFDFIGFATFISIAVFSYYKTWIITPSYNWLGLLSILLIFIVLLRVVSYKQKNYGKYITIDYILLSFGLSLSFMAKPTIALVMTIVSILFLIYEYKNIDIKKAFLSVTVFTSFIVVLHIVVLDGGFSAYYDRLTVSMQEMSMMGGGHTLADRYTDMARLIKKFFFEKFYFHSISVYSFYGVAMVVSILYLFRNRVNSLYLYLVLMFVVLSGYSYFMLRYSIVVEFRLLWIRSIEFLFLNILLIIVASLFVKDKKTFFSKILNIMPLIFILILGCFAFMFGTSNQIIYAMSGSIVFIMASILVLNYQFDNLVKIKFFAPLTGLITSIFIYFIINNAYANPYRLVTDIKGQNQKVELLGGLYLDKQNKQYVEKLQKLKKRYNPSNKKIALIDMTGGSPGANVSLSADIFGTPWLLGSYKGSNKFAFAKLVRYKETKKLKQAWILISPNGSIKLNLGILNKVGLNYPKDYQKIGILKTAHRNEIQELWIPIDAK